MNAVAPALASSILLAYALSLWWLLRDEQPRALLWLTVLSGIALVLRVACTGDYPPGFNEDEPKILESTVLLLRNHRFFAQDSTGVPALLSMLFEAQLAEIIGPSRWAMRSYSLLGSVLSVPAAFAAARSLGLRVAPSLVAAGLVAVLPWSIFYGRVHQSGDMVFHELLLVNALARFLGQRGGWPEIGMGAMSLCFLFYGYFSGRALLGLTLVAAVLARGRYRVLCLAVVLFAFFGWLPFVVYSNSPHVMLGLSAQQTEGGLGETPIAVLERKAVAAATVLIEPLAWDMWLTVRAAAVHPPIVLALALLGSLTGWRRGLFLWAGFIGGMAPAILGSSLLPSTRRMLMAMPFVSLAAACAFDLIPQRHLRAGLGAIFVLLIGVHSAAYFFSPDFWPARSIAVFDPERSQLVQNLPPRPHAKVIFAKGLTYQYAPTRLFDGNNNEQLVVDNWFPPNGQERIYVFQWQNGPLQPFYRRLVGARNVRSFGRAFYASIPAADWSWMRRYGWSYRVDCDNVTRRKQVPVLFHFEMSIIGALCPFESTHIWRGRWLGAPARLVFRFAGKAEIEKTNGLELGMGRDYAMFDVGTGDEITVRLKVPPVGETEAMLYQQTPAGDRLPLLESVEPLP